MTGPTSLMKSRSDSLSPDQGSSPPRTPGNTPIIEGDRKSFFATDRPDVLIQAFKSNGSDNGKKGVKKSPLASLKNEITSYLFEYIEGFHIPTHFIRKMSEHEMLVRNLEVLPLNVHVYNCVAGDLSSRLSLSDGAALDVPVFEHYYTSEKGQSWVNEFHCYAIGLLTPDEFKQMNRISSKVNAVLRSLCSRRGLTLAEVKLSFGRYKGLIYLGGDLTPETITVWDTPVTDPAARLRFAPGGEGEQERHAEFLQRLSLKA
jgi:phosphoribosylaminoimidazole-succinocarboxamide synthase